LPYIFRTVALIVREIVELDESQEAKEKLILKRSNSKMKLTTVDTRAENLYSGNVELDPSKMHTDDGESGHDYDGSGVTEADYGNVLALSLLCQRFVTAIKKSVKNMPPELKNVLIHVKMCVDQRFANSKEISAKAVGSHLLLRLINPAIITPEAFGVTPSPPSERARRQLLLVTKVLQNLANNVRFGSKEQHMTPMNSFLDQNQDSFNEFLLSLGDTMPTEGTTSFIPNAKQSSGFVTTVDGDAEGPLTVPEDIYQTHVGFLALHVKDNLPKIQEKLETKAPPEIAKASNENMALVIENLPSTQSTTKQ
jgi:neurofibromin 1